MAGPSFEPGRPTEPTILFKPAPVASAGLPKGVREKLKAILEHADALYRQVPLFEERHETNTARRDAQRRLERLLAHPHDGGFNLREDDVRMVQQKSWSRN